MAKAFLWPNVAGTIAHDPNRQPEALTLPLGIGVVPLTKNGKSPPVFPRIPLLGVAAFLASKRDLKLNSAHRSFDIA